MQISEIIRKAVDEARRTMGEGQGGPFGAAIIDPEGKIYVSSNTVLGSKDPTAHAEVNAIRKACRERGSHDLTGCVLYTTCYPCPMCLGAIYWAHLDRIFYANNRKDAAEIDFDDDFIYEEIAKPLDGRKTPVIPILRNEALAVFAAWKDKADKIEY